MAISDRPFPKFAKPPVVEVALGVQFQALPRLRTIQMASLSAEYKDKYPDVTEHPPLDGAIERFDPPQNEVTIQTAARAAMPLPRMWFVSEDKTRLIQVQSDRFVFNWRARPQQGLYPSYEKIRAEFAKEFGRFISFVDRMNLGPLRPNQCEVSYFNHIGASESWSGHGELAKVINFCSTHYSDDFLPEPETARLAAKYLMKDSEGNRVGRLNVTLEPAFRKEDAAPILNFTLMARGDPNGDDAEAVFRFLDLGHEWVVRGFTTLTTPEAHKIWGRHDGDTD